MLDQARIEAADKAMAASAEKADQLLASLGMIVDGISYKFGSQLEKRMAWHISSAPYEIWKPKVTSIGISTPFGSLLSKPSVVKTVAYSAKGFGIGLGLLNAHNINEDYQNGEINGIKMGIEQTSNAYSVLGPYGVWWGLGWEIGRGISKTDGWQNWRDNTAVPTIGKAIDYFR